MDLAEIRKLHNEKRLANLRASMLKRDGLDKLTPEQLVQYRIIKKKWNKRGKYTTFEAITLVTKGSLDAVSQVRSLPNQTPRRDEDV